MADKDITKALMSELWKLFDNNNYTMLPEPPIIDNEKTDLLNHERAAKEIASKLIFDASLFTDFLLFIKSKTGTTAYSYETRYDIACQIFARECTFLKEENIKLEKKIDEYKQTIAQMQDSIKGWEKTCHCITKSMEKLIDNKNKCEEKIEL